MINLVQKKRDEQLCKEYKAGATLQELAAKHNIAHTTVRSAVLRVGGTLRVPGYRKDESPDDLAERNKDWRKEYESGKTAGQLAIKYKVNTSTIIRGIVSAGGSIRKQGRPRKA